MPETTRTHTRPMGTAAVVSECLLMLPSEVDQRLEMFRLNGGKPIELPRRTLADCAGPMALTLGGGADAPREPFMRLGRTAVISIDGPITFAASFWSWMCGGISVPEITRALYAAAADPDIDRVCMDFECPGGQQAGISEIVEAIRHVRTLKPVLSYGHDLVASLAMWMMSETDWFVATPSARVGSVGAIALAADTSAQYERAGVRVHAFTEASSKTLNRPGQVITDEMVEAEMAVIRSMGRAIRGAVSTKTGISEDELLAMQGAVYYAPEAMAMGLIDQIMAPSAFYTALENGDFDRHWSGNANNDTQTSGADASAQIEDTTMSIKLSDLTAEQRAQLKAEMSEEENKDKPAATEDEDKKPTATEDEDKKPTSEEDEDKKPAAEEDEENEDAPAAALSMKQARAVLADFDMPKAAVNELACECLEHGWNETTLLRKALKKSRETASTAAIEQEAAADTTAIGGGRGSAGGATKGGANAKIDAIAKAMCDANPSMNHAAARARVIKENDGLREQYCAEVNEARLALRA